MEYLKLLKTQKINPHNFVLTNCDTDSISFKKADEKKWSKAEVKNIIEEINALMPEKIRWEDDGVYRRFIVIRAKNYLMDDGKKIVIKGSALKGTMKEPALQKFIGEVLELLRTDQKDLIFPLYAAYVGQIMAGVKINEWAFKKTITKNLMNGERKNETRVMDALKGTALNEGDKVFVFVKEVIDWKKPKKEQKIYELRDNFSGQYCKRTLLRKLYDTLEIFDTVIDVSLFPNYSKTKNWKLLGLSNE